MWARRWACTSSWAASLRTRFRLVALARNAQGWGNLCQFITAARRSAAKGSYQMGPFGRWQQLQGCELLLVPERYGAKRY